MAEPRRPVHESTPLALNLDGHESNAIEGHGTSRIGYLSNRCSYGYDGCDDRACVCRCHDQGAEQTGPDINAAAIAEMRAVHLAHNGEDIGCGC